MIIKHHFEEPAHYPTVLQVHVAKDACWQKKYSDDSTYSKKEWLCFGFSLYISCSCLCFCICGIYLKYNCFLYNTCYPWKINTSFSYQYPNIINFDSYSKKYPFVCPWFQRHLIRNIFICLWFQLCISYPTYIHLFALGSNYILSEIYLFICPWFQLYISYLKYLHLFALGSNDILSEIYVFISPWFQLYISYPKYLHLFAIGFNHILSPSLHLWPRKLDIKELCSRFLEKSLCLHESGWFPQLKWTTHLCLQLGGTRMTTSRWISGRGRG